MSKRRSECILALAQLSPLYMSPNAEEGKRECEQFFPEGYAETLEEEDMGFETLSMLSVEKGAEEFDTDTEDKGENEIDDDGTKASEDNDTVADNTDSIVVERDKDENISAHEAF